MKLKVFAVALLAVALVGSLFVIPVAEGAPPQPHTFYGVARQSNGIDFVLSGTRITTFIDGVDYSNGTSVYNSAGNYDVDVYGDNHTDLFNDNTPEVKTGGDIGDETMFVAGDMTGSGQVFTANRPWGLPSPGAVENLDLTLAMNQPALLKIRSITTRPNDPWPQYVYICNPTAGSVDLTPYLIEKDSDPGFFGPRHGLLGAVPLIVAPGGLSYVNLTTWDVPATTLAPTGDSLKLVWDNPGGTGFGGSNIVVDRVEYNQTGGGGLIYQIGEPTNTLMTDAAGPSTVGFEIRRKGFCQDTNDNFNDFTAPTETGRPGSNPAPAVSLTTPNGGQDWTGGTMHDIVWDMSDDPDTSLLVTIDLDVDGDGLYETVVFSGSRTEGTGLTYPWNVNLVDTATARIRVCVFDGGGLSACDFSAGPFTIDSTRPQLVGTNPADLAIDVDPNADIVLTFGEGMARVSTEGAITFTPLLNPPGTFTPTWNPQSTVLTINPDSTLSGNTLYAVTVGCGARDDSDTGNILQACPDSFSFTTAGGAIAPTVDLTSPDGGEVWTGGSVHDIVWTMNDADSGPNLNVDLHYSTTGGGPYPNVIQLGLSRPEGPNTYAWTVPCIDSGTVRVQATVSDGALSTADASVGNVEVDCTAPTVLSTDAPTGAVDVPIGKVLRVVFSETMNRLQTELAFSLSPPPGGYLYAWSTTTFMDDTVDISHNQLQPCIQHTASFSVPPSPIARDASDPGMALAPYSWTFTTGCAPTVTVSAPAGGESWTCGSTQSVTFTATDTAGAVQIWINMSRDGGADLFPDALYGPLLHGTGSPVSVSVNLPPTADTGNAVLRVTAQDPTSLDGSGVSQSFTVDCNAPSVLSSTPANAATNVGLGAPFTITFDEDMDPTTACNAITLTPSAWTGNPACTWLAPDRVQVSHTKLVAGRAYTLAVASTARDASSPGNLLDPEYTAVFMTTPNSGLNAVISGPASGTVSTAYTYSGSGSTPPSEITAYRWEVRSPSVVSSFPTPGQSMQFTFTQAGSWTVILNVTDVAGNWDTAELTVVVTGDGGVGFLDQYWWVILLLLLAVLGAILFLVLGKRRKKEEEMPEAVPAETVETIPPAAPTRAPPKPAAPPRPAPSRPAAPPPTTGVGSATKECPTCGTIVDGKDTECFMCGSKV